MYRETPRSTRTDTLLPDPTLFRSVGRKHAVAQREVQVHQRDVELEVVAAAQPLQHLGHRPEGKGFDLVVVRLWAKVRRQREVAAAGDVVAQAFRPFAAVTDGPDRPRDPGERGRHAGPPRRSLADV